MSLGMPIKLGARLLDRLDLERAVQDELAEPMDALPSRVLENALASNPQAVAAMVSAQCASGLEVRRAETIWLPKPGHLTRRRPVHQLPIAERVLVRALANDIADMAPDYDRSPAAQEEFRRGPQEQGWPYVVVADVASFYYFVDHSMLGQRIVDTSARADTAEALRRTLGAELGRTYGLPQSFAPSQLWSELYILPVEQRLLRGGIPVLRHNDDFRLGADDWGAALRALERLQDEVSLVGLDLNGEKTRILKAATYAENQGLVRRLVADALAEADLTVDIVDFDPYTGEPLVVPEDDEIPEPEDEEILDEEADGLVLEDGVAQPNEGPGDQHGLAEVVGRAFDEAVSRRLVTGHEVSPAALEAGRRVITASLSILTRLGSPIVADRSVGLLAVDPALGRQLVAYIQTVSPDGESVTGWIERAIAAFRGHVPHWTQAWLMQAFVAPESILTGEIETWLNDFLVSEAPAALRVRAALALARHGRIDEQAIANLVDAVPHAASPDLAAALALISPDETTTVRAVVRSNQILTMIWEYVRERRERPDLVL